MKNKEKTKKMITNALLLGIGAILHQITPALGLPMQPDFALVMLFIIMILNRGDYKISLIAGIITGIFTGMTTKFPGGQLSNMIDKIITVNLVFLIIISINKLKVLKSMTENKRRIVESIIVFPIGTLISGVTFLLFANILVGLPAGFTSLFLLIVLPSMVINLIVGLMIFKIISTSMKRVTV